MKPQVRRGISRSSGRARVAAGRISLVGRIRQARRRGSVSDVLTGVHLKGVRAKTLRAIEAGRPDWAGLESGVQPTAWPKEDRRMPGYRVQALDADPACAPYLLHLVLDEAGVLLGRIGCHAGPDP